MHLKVCCYYWKEELNLHVTTLLYYSNYYEIKSLQISTSSAGTCFTWKTQSNWCEVLLTNMRFLTNMCLYSRISLNMRNFQFLFKRSVSFGPQLPNTHMECQTYTILYKSTNLLFDIIEIANTSRVDIAHNHCNSSLNTGNSHRQKHTRTQT